MPLYIDSKYPKNLSKKQPLIIPEIAVIFGSLQMPKNSRVNFGVHGNKFTNFCEYLF